MPVERAKTKEHTKRNPQKKSDKPTTTPIIRTQTKAQNKSAEYSKSSWFRMPKIYWNAEETERRD